MTTARVQSRCFGVAGRLSVAPGGGRGRSRTARSRLDHRFFLGAKFFCPKRSRAGLETACFFVHDRNYFHIAPCAERGWLDRRPAMVRGNRVFVLGRGGAFDRRPNLPSAGFFFSASSPEYYCYCTGTANAITASRFYLQIQSSTNGSVHFLSLFAAVSGTPVSI